MELSEILKALSDHNRLRIVNLLGDKTLCVCDLEEVLAINQSNLSRHLAKLKQAGLVSATKRGQFMYYSRKVPSAPHQAAVEAIYTAMLTDDAWASDREAFARRFPCC